MQCYEYLATQQYARRYLGDWTERYDDLELAEVLDERRVRHVPEIERMSRAGLESIGSAR